MDKNRDFADLSIRCCIAECEGFKISDEARDELESLETQLTAARAVIREFVHPGSPMTPAQKDAWAALENGTTHTCARCNTPLQAVRPGKWQCPECE